MFHYSIICHQRENTMTWSETTLCLSMLIRPKTFYNKTLYFEYSTLECTVTWKRTQLWRRANGATVWLKFIWHSPQFNLNGNDRLNTWRKPQDWLGFNIFQADNSKVKWRIMQRNYTDVKFHVFRIIIFVSMGHVWEIKINAIRSFADEIVYLKRAL